MDEFQPNTQSDDTMPIDENPSTSYDTSPVPPTAPSSYGTSPVPPTAPSSYGTSPVPPTAPSSYNTSPVPPTAPSSYNTSPVPPTAPSSYGTSPVPPTAPSSYDTSPVPPTAPSSYNTSSYNPPPSLPYSSQWNAYSDGSSYHFQQNYYTPPMPHKRGKGIHALLWGAAAFMLIMAVGIIVMGMGSSSGNDFSLIFGDGLSKEDTVPSNKYTESSYATDVNFHDAPSAEADLNGPQISALEPSGREIVGNANRAYENAAPSIVCITSYEAGKDYVLTKNGDGSGIIITADGYIATNSHVVDDSKETGVMVTLVDGTQYLGTIIGIDIKTDLAVIKIDADSLKAAQFADSDNLYVGQDAYAIGNPGGSKYSNSLTKGTVSALNRVVSTGYVKYIQTDAAINPGNSGGALINDDGQVIGMNTIKLVGTDYEGMGFAIPSNQVIEIINKLIKYGYVHDRGTLAIEGANCTLYQSKMKNVPQGVIINKIHVRSPLYSTEAREKDIITAINGVEIKDFTEFIDELKKFKPDDEVTLTLFRVPDDPRFQPSSFNVTVKLIPDE